MEGNEREEGFQADRIVSTKALRQEGTCLRKKKVTVTRR